MSESLILRNGIDIDTGRYLPHPLHPSQVTDLACGRPITQDPFLSSLKDRHKVDLEVGRGMTRRLEARDLAQTGWGVLFARDDPRGSEIQAALSPLLLLRKRQAEVRCAHFYREFKGEDAVKPEMSVRSFLGRYGATPGAMPNPDKVPYYLLIVASPHQISYQFQYELDVQYAVGRLCFDRIGEYARYARNVVAAEQRARPRRRRAVFFGVENPDDELTRISCRQLVEPMAAQVDAPKGWKVESILGNAASKVRLASLLGGKETPNILMTAGHGISYAKYARTRRKIQGSLICSEWRGPGFGGRPGDYFAASDLPKDADLRGLISFHFACYSAGVPHENELASVYPEAARPLSRRPFVARLPQRMLSRKSGALAVVGHVDSAWDAPTQLSVFTETFNLLMDGYPVGAALDVINERHAALSVELVKLLAPPEPQRDLPALGKVWTETYDTKAYAVLGDPAVRVPGTWTRRR